MVRICSICSTSQNLPEDSIACGFDVKTYSEEDHAGRGLKELSVGEAMSSSARRSERVGGTFRLTGTLLPLLENAVQLRDRDSATQGKVSQYAGQDGFPDNILSLFNSSATKAASLVLLAIAFLANSGHHIGILKVGVDDTRSEGLFL